MPKHKDWIEGKIIDHKTGQPEDYVDYLLEQEYSSTPSTLIQYPLNPQEEANIAYYDALGASSGKDDKWRRSSYNQVEAQEGDGWKLGVVLTLIAIIVIVGLVLK